MAFLFERLAVYQAAIHLSQSVLSETGRYPRRFEFLALQTSRAAVSVAANIAESQGRFGSGERRQFLVIARGSLMECLALLEIASRMELISGDQYARFRSQVDRLARMLTGMMKRHATK